jgi:hypothetical protein
VSDIGKDLDGAARRLKDGTPDPNPARVKNPSYHVFVYIDDHGVDGWRQITDETNPVSASSRKEAIKAVAPSTSGRFLVIPAKEFVPISRKTRTETVDDWE